MEAVKDAGLTQIDNLIITHWHGDHFGGFAELAKQIPIKHYWDHGPNVQPGQAAGRFPEERLRRLISKAAAYGRQARRQDSARCARTSPSSSRPGMPIAAMKGAGTAQSLSARTSSRSTTTPKTRCRSASWSTYGKFKALHLGDNTRNKEFELACPVNRLGTVDLMLGMHHGQASSNSPVLVHALRPRVAIVNNGTRKGGEPFAMQSMFSSPGLEDVWQMHFSLLSGQEYTVPGTFIANQIDQPDGDDADRAPGRRRRRASRRRPRRCTMGRRTTSR